MIRRKTKTYAQKTLVAEVTELIERAICNNRIVAAQWLAHELMKSHEAGIEGAASPDWHIQCAYEGVKNAVREAVRRYEPSEAESDPQIIMQGFERLQKAYSVQRDGQHKVIPIDYLTDAEIDAKVDELECMAAGCTKHAEELKRYKNGRGITVTATAS